MLPNQVPDIKTFLKDKLEEYTKANRCILIKLIPSRDPKGKWWRLLEVQERGIMIEMIIGHKYFFEWDEILEIY